MRMQNLNWLRIALLGLAAALCGSGVLAQDSPTPAPVTPAAASMPVATFPSAKAAANAFISAVRVNASAALTQILGEKASELLSSGDSERDEQSRLNFIKNYDTAHALVYEGKERATLTVGTKEWPLPFPIVRANGVWYFDADAGAQELAYRRIGADG